MLDNPNLSLEKMLEVIASGKEVVGIAFLIIVIFLLYLYRYEVSLFIKHGFSKGKNDTSFQNLSN